MSLGERMGETQLKFTLKPVSLTSTLTATTFFKIVVKIERKKNIYIMNYDLSGKASVPDKCQLPFPLHSFLLFYLRAL